MHLLFSHLDTIAQALHNKLLSCAPTVDVLDIVSRRLEVAGGIVALRDKDIIVGATLNGLV